MSTIADYHKDLAAAFLKLLQPRAIPKNMRDAVVVGNAEKVTIMVDVAERGGGWARLTRIIRRMGVDDALPASVKWAVTYRDGDSCTGLISETPADAAAELVKRIASLNLVA